MARKAGFSLLEMLIAVTIFSGLIILVVATFARSAGSSARVTVLREKTAAAQQVVDQLTTDFRFIYTAKSFKDHSNANPVSRGYYFADNRDRLVLLLKFPGSTEEDLVRKEYWVNGSGASADLQVHEERSCRLVGTQNNLTCQQINQGYQSVLADGFVLDYQPPSFQGQLIDSSPNSLTGYLTLRFTLKPVDSQAQSCQSLPTGTCYSIETTISAGGQTS